MEKKIILNGEAIELPVDVNTVEQLLQWKKIPNAGTAVAINGRLVPQKTRSVRIIDNLDNIIVVSAAYGG